MSEFEGKINLNIPNIQTPDQVTRRFKKLRRIKGVKERAGEPTDELIVEMTKLADYLETVFPNGTRPSFVGRRREQRRRGGEFHGS